VKPRPRRRARLVARLIRLFLLLALLPLASSGVVTYHQARKSLEESTIHHLVAVSNLKEVQLARWMEENEESLEELAVRPGLREHAAILVTTRPSAPEYRSARRSILEHHFIPTVQRESGFLELFLLAAADGRVLVSSERKHEGMYREAEPYFLEGKKGSYVQNAYYSMLLESPALTIATPVRGRTGDAAAVLAVRIDLDDMTEIMLQGVELNGSEETYLVDRFNFFVTRSRFEPDSPLKKAVHTEGVYAALRGGSGVGMYENYLGVPVIGVYRWLPEHELAVLTEMALAEAFAAVYDLRNIMFGIGFAAALIVALLALVLSRNFDRLFGRLLHGTEQIGRGNLEYRIKPAGEDEFGRLTGAFNSMAASLQDVTASRDDLDREVRTRRRTEAELLKAKEEAERANSAKSVFLAGMSHELRTPLNAIIGFSEVLRDGYFGTLNEKQTEYVGDIVDSGRHLLSLINDILDLSKVEAGRMGLEPSEVDVADLLEGSLVMIKEKAMKHGIGLDLRVSQEVKGLVIRADRRKLKQIMFNLLSNAAKFTPERGSIHVEGKLVGRELVVSVSDTGIGVPEEEQERIFEEFYQSRARGAGKTAGTGLGLPLSRQLVEMHGGRIWVESAGTGKGSRFSFALPVQRGQKGES